MADDDQGVTFEDATGQAAPAPVQPTQSSAGGEQGRQITVRARPTPKPPPAPIAPHPSEPLSVQPNVVAPPAVGQEPPQPSKIAHEDEGVPFEQVAPPAYPGLATDVGKGAWGGLAEGVEGLAGLPHDIPKFVDYGLDWAGAHLAQAVGGPPAEETIKASRGSAMRELGLGHLVDAFGEIPVPGAADYQRWFQKAGVDPGYAPQSLPGRYAHEIAAFLPGAALPIGEAGMLTRLGQSVGPAIGSETLGHAAQGTSFEPWARGIGAIFGGLTQMGAGTLAAPLTKSGQADKAADILRERATNPETAAGNIRTAQAQAPPGRATGENIPGSKPTTSQVTGDPGLVGAETEYQKDFAVQHSQQWNAQQAAQTKALQGVQPGGDSTKVADAITQRLQQIDQQHEAAVQTAQQAHAAQQQAHGTGVQQAEAAARGATGQVARQGAPEALGANARKAIADSMEAAKTKERALWKAIDPDKNIGVKTHQIAGQARNIARKIGLQKPPEGEERAILEASAGLPGAKGWGKLSDVTELTSRLKTTMRQERLTNGNTPALARMTTMLTTMENVIKRAATRQSAKEAEQDMGRLRQMTPADRKAIMDARAATKARGDIERGPAGAVIRKGATSDSYRTIDSQVPGKIFAKGPTGYQKAKAYADATGKPWLDPFKDIVSDSMAEHATTNGMIDPAKLAKWQKDYDGALRALPDDVRQNFVKGPAEAAAQLAEQAADRRAAMIAHQKIDVAKQMGKSPAEAMRKEPAFKGFEGQTSVRDIQHLVGGLFARPDAERQITQLRTFLAGQPGGANAVEGLKRAALDHMLSKIETQTQAGAGSGVKALKPGMTQKLVASYKPIMAAAGFSPQQLRVMDQVADDIERQQSLYSTTIPRGSSTAQKQAKALKAIEGGAHSGAGLLGAVLAGKEIYESMPESLHGPVGLGVAAAGYGVKHLYTKARNAGIAKAHDMYHDAVMDPDKAAELFSRPNPRSRAALTEKYGRQAMFAGLAADRSMTLKRAQ